MVESIVITGVGLITPAGRGVSSNWSAVTEGLSFLTEDAQDGLPRWARWAGRVVDLKPPETLPGRLRSQLRFVNRGGLLALAASHDAVAQAGAPDHLGSDRRSLYLATGDLTAADCRGLSPATRQATGSHGQPFDAERLNRGAVDQVNPFFLLTTLANNPFSIVSAAHALDGPGTTLASHSPNGGHALDLAFRSLAAGRTDVAVVAASGSWLDLVPRLEMASIGLLSSCRHGGSSFRPLDRHRDGFIVGEGGAALVLERASSARSRGARVLGVIEATSSCHEPSSVVAPNDHITLRCMQQALSEAGISTDDIGFVNLHGSGTRKGDRAELRSVAEFSRQSGRSIPLCGLKAYTGHMGAASDIGEVIIGLEAARRNQVPGTLNFDAPDAEFHDARISHSLQDCSGMRFLSVSYGLGGQSSAAMVHAATREVRG